MNICQARSESRRKGLPTYFTGKPCRRGHVAPRRTESAHCVDCEQGRDRTTEWKLRRGAITEAHAKDPRGQLLRGARHRAKKKGLPFDLKPIDIFVPALCPVLGIPLHTRAGKSGYHDNAPTIDRFAPDLGYVKGNVAVISARANRIKVDATLQELDAVAAWMRLTGKTQVDTLRSRSSQCDES